MEVGRGHGGPRPPMDFEIFIKNVVFSVLSGKKQISPLLAPLEKFWKTPFRGPFWKNSIRRPW